MTTPATLQPGDLLLTRSPTGIFGRAIRFFEALSDETNQDNHVAIAYRYDAMGRLWVNEGRPGGVGEHVATDYVRSPWTMNNIGQPKTPEQRKIVADGSEKLHGTAYDWLAIADDALNAFGMHIHDAWGTGGRPPGAVVCSSLAAYLYAKAGLPHPAGDRLVTPADWADLVIHHGWNVKL